MKLSAGIGVLGIRRRTWKVLGRECLASVPGPKIELDSD